MSRSLALPVSCVFAAPDRSWIVVRVTAGFRVCFADRLMPVSDSVRFWRDSGFGLFDSCAAAVAFVDSCAAVAFVDSL